MASRAAAHKNSVTVTLRRELKSLSQSSYCFQDLRILTEIEIAVNLFKFQPVEIHLMRGL